MFLEEPTYCVREGELADLALMKLAWIISCSNDEIIVRNQPIKLGGGVLLRELREQDIKHLRIKEIKKTLSEWALSPIETAIYPRDKSWIAVLHSNGTIDHHSSYVRVALVVGNIQLMERDLVEARLTVDQMQSSR